MTKLTTERLEKRIKNCIEVGNGCVMLPVSMAEELLAYKKAAERLVRCKGRYHSEQNYRALAALFGVTIPDLPPLPTDEAPAQPVMAVQEIVGWICEDELPKNYPYDAMFVHSKVDVVRMFPVFAPSAAQPVIPEQTERERIRREHAEWSDATFGNVGPVGPLKHLSKEALEAAADPDDLLEWADMQFLLWDAQRRMGIPDDFITIAMAEKLEINKKRQWPEPKDGEPRLHINTQSAQPVMAKQWRSFVTDADIAALHRFVECCDDPESGGHDLEKEQVQRLEQIGALQRSGRISYITDFGDYLISVAPAQEGE